MNQSGCDDNFHELKAEGLLVVDSTRVDRIPTRRFLSFPFSQMAREKLGNPLAANMITLGAVGYLSGRVSLKHLESAVAATVPKGTQALNQKALRMGFTAAKKVSLDDLPPSVTEEEDEV
jgi:2-oxoglutarate ferredoxin oxidoreductase subunit gamma